MLSFFLQVAEPYAGSAVWSRTSPGGVGVAYPSNVPSSRKRSNITSKSTLGRAHAHHKKRKEALIKAIQIAHARVTLGRRVDGVQNVPRKHQNRQRTFLHLASFPFLSRQEYWLNCSTKLKDRYSLVAALQVKDDRHLGVPLALQLLYKSDSSENASGSVLCCGVVAFLSPPLTILFIISFYSFPRLLLQ